VPNADTNNDNSRGHWGSHLGFILAAAGSAVGLGNIWKFPYITGINGGGAFVVVYLLCVAFVGLPVMTAEIMIGRASQRSTVSAFHRLAPREWWGSIGWLGALASFCLFSYYATVAGWALHYTYLALTGQIVGPGAEAVQEVFGGLQKDGLLSVFWHLTFILLTVAVVLGGVAKGVERWAKILMPALMGMLVILLGKAMTMSGWNEGFSFVFGFNTEKLTSAGVLEALGHAFFTLSLGMGAMLTYGSYLHKSDDIVAASIATSALDTIIALVAALVLFPIIFSFGMEPGAGPGLIFVTIPIALAQMTGGTLMAIVFFGLLVFAALTSSISMLEVAASYLIDEKGWMRSRAVWLSGAAVAVFGLPSALSGSTAMFGSSFASVFGGDWFTVIDYLVSNWMLPLGGFGVALFVGWRLEEEIRHDHFLSGSRFAMFYRAWLFLLKYMAPLAILLVFLHALGLL